MSKKVIEQIQEEFFKRLDEKTSWGKEKLKNLYLEVKTKVLTNALEEK